jgi:hypothetical protein
MTQYRLICHHCGATIITACPEEVMWELCTGCKSHLWDIYDLMMAEVTREGRKTERTTGMMAC